MMPHRVRGEALMSRVEAALLELIFTEQAPG
jgi:hypothetical protein